MKYFKRTLAWLLTVCMVMSMFIINDIVAKAEGPAVKIIEFSGITSISDGNACYKIGDSELTTEVTVFVDSVAQSITSSNEHNELQVDSSKISTVSFSIRNFDTESMQAVIRGAGGYQQILTVTEGSTNLAGLTLPEGVVNFSVEAKNTSGSGGEEQNPPTGTEVNANVSCDGEFGMLQIGGTGILGTTSGDALVLVGQKTITAHLESDNTNIKIVIQAAFLKNYDSIKVNDVEKFTAETSDGQYTITIPKTDLPVEDGKVIINIKVHVVESTKKTIVWSYDKNSTFGEDAYVENGTVDVVNGVVENNPGHCVAEIGSVVTIKLIPAYGYQVVGAKINGEVNLVASNEIGHDNEFSFEMPATNVHFKGIFTKTSDIVSNSSSAVSGASFDGSNVATTGGTAKMTIKNATPASTTSVSGVDTSKSVQAVDITMDQLFYKNTASDVWSTNKTDLDAAAEVSLTVNQAADGYTVLRTHNGAVEEIPANYDSTTQKITFASDKYSTYTLVPVKKSNNTYVPEAKLESKSETKEESEEETQQPVVVEEVIKEVKQVMVDKTALALQTEQVIPTTTFNFSSVKTFKGFMTSVEKASQQTRKANPKAKVVSIYTNKPFCLNRNILETMKKTNQTFVYYFMHKNHLYSITVPADIDLSKVLEKNGFAGPLYIGKLLGTTVMIK